MYGDTRNALARLYQDGTLDKTINPDANGQVVSIAVQKNEKILFGGTFTSVLGGISRYYIARINPDGFLDDFDPMPSDYVLSIAVQKDEKILIGGYFTSVGMYLRNRLARLYTDGSVEESFNPNVSGAVYCIVVQEDGKILIGGEFTHINGVEKKYIARLNSDGTIDDTFYSLNFNNIVRTIALQEDGKIIIGGDFTDISGKTMNHIARLFSDGTLDSDFNPNANGNVETIAVEADGNILVGGDFTRIGGTDIFYLARIKPDGTADKTFNTNCNGWVFSISLLSDNKILVGGSFTSIGGQVRNRVALLNKDGTVVTDFNPNANSFVNAVAVEPDGKVLLGGNFTTVGSQIRNYIARISSYDSAIYNLNVSADGTEVDWLKSQSAPEVYDVSLYYSENDIDYTYIGNAQRISNGWQKTGLSLPFNQIGYLKIIAKAYGGQYNGSTSIVEFIKQFYNKGYSLTVSKLGMGSGTVISTPAGINCGDDCSEIYPENNLVILLATAQEGSSFAGWGGNCTPCGFNIVCSVPMSSNKNCTATFNLNYFSPKPIPDGTNSTEPMRATKISPDGNQIEISFDEICSPSSINIIYGNLGTISNYTISGSKCGISNPDIWDTGSITNIWFVLVSDNLNGTESSWGYSSSGERNGTNASGQCGNNNRDNSETCP